MTGAAFIAGYLSSHGTTDAFGVPGGVILDLIYALNRQKGITPHLSYHEQSAGFAACGYAQSSGRLGVAYSTRGPGFTNLLTAVSDAFYDSLPVLFITAHSSGCPPSGTRVMSDQEMDTCDMVRNITKFSARIDDADELVKLFPEACRAALAGRKGSVFLDVSDKVLREEISCARIVNHDAESVREDVSDMADELEREIRAARRPLLLVGDGINQAGAIGSLRRFLSSSGLPCLSSRFSHNVAGECENYFGYIGSHGIRVANFILSKADLVVSMGNRLNVSTKSFSFSNVLTRARFLRYEIDDSEFVRKFPNELCRKCDVVPLLNCLSIQSRDFGSRGDWFQVCEKLRCELHNEDINPVVISIAKVMKCIQPDMTIVADVGNHEFFVSRAAVYCKLPNRVLYSKSFGAMGSALGRSIGTYYATRKPVVCFVGDQGFQFNIQELQYVSMHSLPITLVLLNNGVSGMIRDKERNGYENFLHVSRETGFGSPDFRKIMDGYGISYSSMTELTDEQLAMIITRCSSPVFIDCKVVGDVGLTPSLPRDSVCQNLQPALPLHRYQSLNNL